MKRDEEAAEMRAVREADERTRRIEPARPRCGVRAARGELLRVLRRRALALMAVEEEQRLASLPRASTLRGSDLQDVKK